MSRASGGGKRAVKKSARAAAQSKVAAAREWIPRTLGEAALVAVVARQRHASAPGLEAYLRGREDELTEEVVVLLLNSST
jgi:uncharacterized protein involved in propanediol utilization